MLGGAVRGDAREGAMRKRGIALIGTCVACAGSAVGTDPVSQSPGAWQTAEAQVGTVPEQVTHLIRATDRDGRVFMSFRNCFRTSAVNGWHP